jgi:hypothetical protein
LISVDEYEDVDIYSKAVDDPVWPIGSAGRGQQKKPRRNGRD